MRSFDELQQAEIRSQFRRMYQDLGFSESLVVLLEIIETANILTEILIEETALENEEREKGQDMEPS